MNKNLLSFVFFATICNPLGVLATTHIPRVSCLNSQSVLFRSTDTLEIFLKSNFPLENPTKAEISVRNDLNMRSIAIPISIEPRGKTRFRKCQFKPIRIIWDQDQQGSKIGTVFEGTVGSDMKLTSHCSYMQGNVSSRKRENELIIKEYMVYKLLKAFGLPVFDVRLARIQYQDPLGNNVVEGMGFFSESSAQWAARCGLKHVRNEDVLNAVGEDMDKQIYLSYLLSRLIADARDFVVEFQGGHNSEVFVNERGRTLALVPYDFNDSGLVNSGISPYWSFSPNFNQWFKLLMKGPFTKDGEIMQLSVNEKEKWERGLVVLAKELIKKKTEVLSAISTSPLSEESKIEFYSHVEMLMKKFVKMADGK